MKAEIPESKLRRSMIGGKAAIQVGGKVLSYLSRKPFLSENGQRKAKAELETESAEILFQSLSLLKGTALKIAQIMSLELDLFPAPIRKELEKSYNQVPPINRALIRKIIQNSFGKPPEALFASFDTQAFAAASLGQVHRAESHSGETLAVKVQYPGIKNTIQNDIQLVKNAFRPLYDDALVFPILNEIEERLIEETDYLHEAENMVYFSTRLQLEDVHVPTVDHDTTSDTVLSVSFAKGDPLNIWLQRAPDQDIRNRIAQRLHDIFLAGLYELNCIHADPNPGNFIIGDNLEIGLIDFGCVKHLDPQFVSEYRQVIRAIIEANNHGYIDLLKKLNVIKTDLDPDIEDQVYGIFYRLADWIRKLFKEEYFDFSRNPEFMQEGKSVTHDIHRLRNHMDPNPNFVFLDRTLYGLLRLFERMQARIRIHSPYEWEN